MPEICLSRGGHSNSRAAPLPRQPDCPGKGSFDLLPETIAGNFTFSLPLRPQVEALPTRYPPPEMNGCVCVPLWALRLKEGPPAPSE